MAKTHTVRVGENAVSIAWRYGFSDYRVIWSDGANANLRKKRPDPHLLIPGDEIAVPDPTPKKLTLPTQQSYRLVVHVPKQELRLHILDQAGKPVAQSPYRLTVETLPKPFEGTTDKDGKLKAIVPVDAPSAVLEIDEQRFRLRLNGLAAMPADDDDPVYGVAARLDNLGYEAATAGESDNAALRTAVAIFQGDAGIDATGEIDQSTQDNLRKGARLLMTDEKAFNVMLGEPGGDTWNTLVLGGTDVIVPVERDPDSDPFQDDEVWLCALDGTVVQRRYTSDDEVEADDGKRLFLYRFADVRYGVYSVWTKLGGRPSEIARGLVVRREGVFMGELLLSEGRQGAGAAAERTLSESDSPTDLSAGTIDDVDQDEGEDSDR